MTATRTDAAVDRAAVSILNRRRSVTPSRSVLSAVTGIDGCGKGFISAGLTRALERQGLRAALINVDGWLNLPDVRFNPENPAEHFYRHAIRFDELFERLVVPLRDRRSIRIKADVAEETASQYRKQLYDFIDVDVIVLEGIYLLKRELQRHYDVSFWINCSFATALRRAVARAQEGLPPDATVEAYRTIYFPAQEIHFTRDNPKSAATAVIENDGP